MVALAFSQMFNLLCERADNTYVTHTNSGEGLLFFGNTTIPFVDRFPQNTELYAIMTTRPEDKKQEMNRA